MQSGDTRGTAFASAAATLGAGALGGFGTGLLIGGIGGRLAMLLLRLTSDPSLRGLQTDDGFTIGIVSRDTIFLLGVTSGLGLLGGVLYLIIRDWMPTRYRAASTGAFFMLASGAGLLRPEGIDFTRLDPLPLAVGMFVAIPAIYGVLMSKAVEALLRDGSWLRKPKRWVVGMAPLIIGFAFGVALAAASAAVWWTGRTFPGLVLAWRSSAVAWAGRGLLILAAATGGYFLIQDATAIL